MRNNSAEGAGREQANRAHPDVTVELEGEQAGAGGRLGVGAPRVHGKDGQRHHDVLTAVR